MAKSGWSNSPRNADGAAEPRVELADRFLITQQQIGDQSLLLLRSEWILALEHPASPGYTPSTEGPVCLTGIDIIGPTRPSRPGHPTGPRLPIRLDPAVP